VLAPEPSSVPTGRAWAVETLRAWSCDAHLDAVRLATSELVGNGVRHARTELELVLSLDAGELRVSVRDGAPGPISCGVPDVHAGSGRGLALVERISDRWGVDPTDDGKTVWAAWNVGRSARDGAGGRR